MKIALNIDTLKKNYQQVKSLVIDHTKKALFLNEAYLCAPITMATTALMLTEPYQRQINKIIDLLVSYGFDPEKAKSLKDKFKGTRSDLNDYFGQKRNSNISIPLPYADQIKNKIEELAFVLHGMDIHVRTNILNQLKYVDFLCADGTFSNLYSLIRELSGESITLEYFIAETKRELLEAKFLEEYKKGILGNIAGQGNQIHAVTALINTISHDFGLAFTTNDEDRYIANINIPTELKQKLNDIGTQHLAHSSENFIDIIARKIIEKLPETPASDANDQDIEVFTERLNAFLSQLPITDISGLAITKDIDGHEIAVAYHSDLYTLIKDYVTLRLHNYHIKICNQAISELLFAYSNAQDNTQELDDFIATLKNHNIFDTHLYKQLLLELTKTKGNDELSPLERGPQGLQKIIKDQIADPIRRVHQLVILEPADSKLLSDKIAIIRAGYSSEEGIDAIKGFDQDMAWETILHRNLKLNAEIFNMEDPWKYAIQNQIQINGKHFLQHFYLKGIPVTGKEVIAFMSSKALSLDDMSKLKNIFVSDEYTFEGYTDPIAQQFLARLGTRDSRMNPLKKYNELIADFDRNKINELIELFQYTPSVTDNSLSLLTIGLQYNSNALVDASISRIGNDNLTNQLLAIPPRKKHNRIVSTVTRKLCSPVDQILRLECINRQVVLEALTVPEWDPAREPINVLCSAAVETNDEEMLSMLLNLPDLNFETLCRSEGYQEAIIRSVKHKRSKSLEILFMKCKQLGLELHPWDLTPLLGQDPESGETLKVLLDFMTAEKMLLSLEPVFSNVMIQNNTGVLRVIFTKPGLDKLALLQKNIIDAPESTTVSAIQYILSKNQDLELLNAILSDLDQESWKHLFLDNIENLTLWLLKKNNGEDNPALKIISQFNAAENALNTFKNSKIKMALLDESKVFTLDDIVKLYQADTEKEVDIYLLRHLATDLISKNPLPLDFNSTARKPHYVSLSRLLFSSEKALKFNNHIPPEIREIDNHLIATAKRFTSLAMLDSENNPLRIIDILKDLTHTLTNPMIYNSQNVTYFRETLHFAFCLYLQKHETPTEDIKSLCELIRNNKYTQLHYLIPKPEIGYDAFSQYMCQLYLDEMKSQKSPTASSEIIQILNSRFIPFIEDFIKNYLQFYPGNFSNLQNVDFGNSYPMRTFLHFALETKSLEVVSAVLRSAPTNISCALLVKTMSARNVFSHSNRTSISPSGFARHLNFSEAIPLMISTVYTKEWNKSIPKEAREFLQDPQLTSAEFTSILHALHEKAGQDIKHLLTEVKTKKDKLTVYDSLSEEKKQIVNAFLLNNLNSRGVAAPLTPYRSIGRKRDIVEINCFNDFKKSVDDLSITDERMKNLFEVYASKTKRTEEFIDKGELSNNNGLPMLNQEEQRIVDTLVERNSPVSNNNKHLKMSSRK